MIAFPPVIIHKILVKLLCPLVCLALAVGVSFKEELRKICTFN